VATPAVKIYLVQSETSTVYLTNTSISDSTCYPRLNAAWKPASHTAFPP